MSGLSCTHWGALVTIAFGVSFCTIDYAIAQITPDGTLPNNSSVTREGNTFNITGGTQAGGNLFHSFGEFSVTTGGAASFNNALDIQNIISRVTGGSVSNIDGIIRTLGTANLFLINPNGIVFGANASLNVGGSFVASTANALQFGNRGLFSATDQNIPSALLTINPSALLFNQINQNAVIQNNSVAFAEQDPAGFNAFGLRVPDGKSLLLVGGNVSMDGGRLNANGGRVELGGLGKPGTVLLGVDDDNLSLIFPSNVGRASVSLTNQAGIYVEGAGGGNIVVNARNLEILGESILSGGIGRGLGTPETVAGDITLDATEEIKFVGSVVSNFVFLGSKGNGGNITIDSGSFSLQDVAGLVASTSGQGNAGNVTVHAKDTVSLADNANIFSTVESGGVGKGGNIDINAATLSLIDGANLQTLTRGASATQPAGRGNAGNVNINVTGAVNIVGEKNALFSESGISSSVDTGAVGNGGNITIDSGSFSLQDGAGLVASTFGQGNAGNVTVHAKDAVSLADNANIFSTVESGSVGKGGNIDINAATLSLTNGANLQTLTRGASATQPAGRGDAGNVNINVTGAVNIVGEKNALFSESGIFSLVDTGTIGNGGNITIDSGSFSLQNGAGLVASTSGQGNAGNVTVHAQDAVSVTNNANISSTVKSGGVGNGGNIDINAATLSLTDGGILRTGTNGVYGTQPAGQGDAGNVNVNVTGAVYIGAEKNTLLSGIRTQLNQGVGNGGNITINSGSFSLQDGAQLSASTYGQGNAGNVTVRARDAVSLADNAIIFSTVSAGGVGKGGNIDINAATLSLTDGAQLLTSTDEATVALIDGELRTFIDGAQQITIVRGAFDIQPAGRGDAGNVNIKVTGTVDIAGHKNSLTGIRTQVSGAVGNGGNITIDSGSFSLQDGAQLSTSTYGQGNAGNVTVRARDAVSLADNAIIFSTVSAGGVGKGGNIDINAATLSLTDGAQLLTSTDGATVGLTVGLIDGELRTFTDDAELLTSIDRATLTLTDSELQIFTDGAQQLTIVRRAFDTLPPGKGDAGNVNVLVTGVVNISGQKNGFLSGISSKVGTGTVGNGGNITIDSGSFWLQDGALLTAETLGQGNAGTIKVNAAAQVNISGKSSNFNSGLFVNSQSATGTAGDIIITSPKVTLDNSGTLNAESASGNGGDINVNSDLLLLRRNSQISTNAGTDKLGGNGGNININSRFILAVANENSDISANAFTGIGGRVDITTNGIFGILRQKSPTENSDITASSQLGVSGEVTINSPDTDPSRGLIQLPSNLVDASQQIAQGCTPRGRQNASRFIATGRGGLPQSPNEPLRGQAVITGWVNLPPQATAITDKLSTATVTTSTDQIVEAQGWIVDAKGDVILVAQSGQSSSIPSAISCSQ